MRPMSVNSLIDLFVPTEDAHDASVSVAMAGLDSGVLAFSDLGAMAAYEPSGPTPMHAALHIKVENTGVLVLLPSSSDSDYATLLEADAVESLLKAVSEKNGCALIVSERADQHGVRAEELGQLPHERARIVHRVWSSLLARDLSFEDAAIRGLRLLGGTGPEGSLEAVGRYATLLPIDASDRGGLIRALNQGLGIGVERLSNQLLEAREEPKKRRRRRRRRRGPKTDQSVESANDERPE